MTSGDDPRGVTRPLLVLVGPPGAGKSTVGKLLAEHLDVPFRDTDHDVEADYGASVADVFFAEGEEGFRERESAALRGALAEHHGVLSLGGGAILAQDNRDVLAGHCVVFLSVGLSDAVSRIGLSAARPVLALNPRAQLLVLLEQRLPLYRAVASVEISTDKLSPEQVRDLVLSAVQL